MKIMHFATLCLAVIIVTGCTIHTVDIQQGNVITKDMVKQLKPGMTRRQVQFVMGTPPIEDPFHANRWDYLYTLQPGTERHITKRKHVVVYFEGDVVSRFEHTLGDLNTPEEKSE